MKFPITEISVIYSLLTGNPWGLGGGGAVGVGPPGKSQSYGVSLEYWLGPRGKSQSLDPANSQCWAASETPLLVVLRAPIEKQIRPPGIFFLVWEGALGPFRLGILAQLTPKLGNLL